MKRMTSRQAREFRDRWQAVAAVEAEEARSASLLTKWEQMNALFRLAIGLRLPLPRSDEEQRTVWERWARLKGVGR